MQMHDEENKPTARVSGREMVRRMFANVEGYLDEEAQLTSRVADDGQELRAATEAGEDLLQGKEDQPWTN